MENEIKILLFFETLKNVYECIKPILEIIFGTTVIALLVNINHKLD